MNKLLLYHHLGLGDHIICHGMVREFCKQHQTTIFCKPHNFETVSDMFCDLNNLQILIGNDEHAQKYIESHYHHFDIIKQIGFGDLIHTLQFEQQFYDLANINFHKKWDNFYIPFNEKAKKIHDQLKLRSYNFIHTDPNRGFNIDRSRIQNSYHNFFTSDINTNSVIHYIELIKRAQEIHVIDSAFMFLIDCMPYNHCQQQLYIHRYARFNEQWLLPILNKPWKILQ
jgi:hypothetical protein